MALVDSGVNASFIWILFFAIVLALILDSCSDKKIEITPEYIINENWSKMNDEGGGNSIKINKMKVKRDSIANPLSDLNNSEILSKLEEDSSFRWFANVKISSAEDYDLYGEVVVS